MSKKIYCKRSKCYWYTDGECEIMMEIIEGRHPECNAMTIIELKIKEGRSLLSEGITQKEYIEKLFNTK